MSQEFSPGTIVENRNRLWRINKETDKIVYATPIDGYGDYVEKFYKPFEDIKESRLNPPSHDRVGNPALQKMLLRAYQLDLIYGTAPLVSLKKSRVIPTEYQMVPVAMALDMPQVRLLLADDVGIGKTVEAGLIITELMARNRASKILFITPANLREQWKDEMQYFFSMDDLRIISRRHKRTMERELPPGTNPWEYYDQLIVSMDYAKKEEVKSQIEAQDWDLILIDEAHKVSKPHQTSPNQNINMKRWELAKDVRDILQRKDGEGHLLFLTATPHNGYTDTFASLIDLLDIGAVQGKQWNPTINRGIAKNHICQRRRRDIKSWIRDSGNDKSLFPDRDQDEEIVKLSSKQEKVIRKLEDLTNHVKKSSERSGGRSKALARWTIMHLHKRALSSPEALRSSLENRLDKLNEMLDELEEDLEDEIENPGISEDEARAVNIDEDTGEELDEEEAAERLEKAVYAKRNDIKTELSYLENVYDETQDLTRRKDNKLQKLYDLLEGLLEIDPKIIIFTKWTDTQEYISESLERRKFFDEYQIFTISGEMSEGERRDKFRDFEKSDKGILIATDCISEGLNLQHACSLMIHYEIPWNPNKLEQRNGRIDRFGQKSSKVYIRSLVMDDTLDAIVLKKLIEKSRQIKKDAGFSPPFFGDKTSLIDLLSEKNISLGVQTTLTEFEKRPGEEIELEGPLSDNELSETVEKIKNDSFYGAQELDFKDIKKRMEKTKEKIGDKETLKSFVNGSLKEFGYSISKDKNSGLYTFIPGNKSKNYKGRIGNKYEDITFDPERATDDPDLDLMDMSHPLVRQIIELVKQKTFEVEERDLYGRTAAWSAEIEEVMVLEHFLVRYSVQTDPVSILEEIIPIGFPLYHNNEIKEEDIVPPEKAEELFELDRSNPERTKDELKKDLKKASHTDLSDIHKEFAEEKKNEIIERRKKFLSKFQNDNPEWAEGMLDVDIASIDHLTTSILYPKVGE